MAVKWYWIGDELVEWLSRGSLSGTVFAANWLSGYTLGEDWLDYCFVLSEWHLNGSPVVMG